MLGLIGNYLAELFDFKGARFLHRATTSQHFSRVNRG